MSNVYVSEKSKEQLKEITEALNKLHALLIKHPHAKLYK